MYQYGQYCPVAKAVEILGDRWTLLIVRDLLTGACHFNDLERGLPGISRSLLAHRLRRLEVMGVVQKVRLPQGRRNTAYYLTDAGRELEQVIGALLDWGTSWAFAEPAESDLDPLLLMWWMRNRICVEALPHGRVVIRFDFTGVKTESYWLLLSREDVSICQSDPGFDLNVLVTSRGNSCAQRALSRLTLSRAWPRPSPPGSLTASPRRPCEPLRRRGQRRAARRGDEPSFLYSDQDDCD